jgi:alpha-mannosidase
MTRRQSYASRETAQRSTRLKRFGALSNEETPVVFVILNNAEYGILKEFVLS